MSIQLLVLRHGPTDWNEKGLYQGRRDIALSTHGSALLRTIQIPKEYQDWDLYSSPLVRASESARILFGREPILEDALMEVNFAQWEGQSIEEIKLSLKATAPRFGKWGWRDRPPGGETYEEVWRRVALFLATLQRDSVVLTHRGVLLTLIAKCWGWDIESKAPHKVNWNAQQLMRYDHELSQPIQLLQLNMHFLSQAT